MREAFLKKLISKVDCGVCGHKYEMSNIKVLDQEDGVWFLSVVCSSCGTKGLIAAVVQDGSIAQVITDLTEDEIERFEEGGVVEVDDVLNMHDFLKEFDGDFCKLFSEE